MILLVELDAERLPGRDVNTDNPLVLALSVASAVNLEGALNTFLCFVLSSEFGERSFELRDVLNRRDSVVREGQVTLTPGGHSDDFTGPQTSLEVCADRPLFIGGHVDSCARGCSGVLGPCVVSGLGRPRFRRPDAAVPTAGDCCKSTVPRYCGWCPPPEIDGLRMSASLDFRGVTPACVGRVAFVVADPRCCVRRAGDLAGTAGTADAIDSLEPRCESPR